MLQQEKVWLWGGKEERVPCLLYVNVQPYDIHASVYSLPLQPLRTADLPLEHL